MDNAERREERASTWEEAAGQIDDILASKLDGGFMDDSPTWAGHPMLTLSEDHLRIVQDWLLESVDEIRSRTDTN